MRRRLSRREQLVRSRSRAKNEIHAVLVRRLVIKPPICVIDSDANHHGGTDARYASSSPDRPTTKPTPNQVPIRCLGIRVSVRNRAVLRQQPNGGRSCSMVLADGTGQHHKAAAEACRAPRPGHANSTPPSIMTDWPVI